jgi:hypothetical protein
VGKFFQEFKKNNPEIIEAFKGFSKGKDDDFFSTLAGNLTKVIEGIEKANAHKTSDAKDVLNDDILNKNVFEFIDALSEAYQDQSPSAKSTTEMQTPNSSVQPASASSLKQRSHENLASAAR